METYQQAIQYNNAGVQALVDCNDSLAVESLSKSIRIMKQSLVKIPAKDQSSLDEDYSFCFGGEEDSDSHETVQLPNVEPGQETFLFNQALHLNDKVGYCSITTTTEPSEQEIHLHTATVIFNLALAHHRRGLKNCSSALLIKSEKLYNMLLKLVAHHGYNTSRMALTVKLASIYNLASLRFDAGNFEGAREGLGELASIVHTASHSGPITNLPMFQEPDLRDLLVNVLTLKPPRVAPAA